jgi:hypothetical protein
MCARCGRLRIDKADGKFSRIAWNGKGLPDELKVNGPLTPRREFQM